MSHSDKLSQLPAGFFTVASTRNSPYARVAHEKDPNFGVSQRYYYILTAKLTKEAIGDRLQRRLIAGFIEAISYKGSSATIQRMNSPQPILSSVGHGSSDGSTCVAEKCCWPSLVAMSAWNLKQRPYFPRILPSFANLVVTHHNAGGLPQRMLEGQAPKLIEPLRKLFQHVQYVESEAVVFLIQQLSDA
ncbi:uncharacterized protein BCR38DRAFT_409945 [Pseudomassariella vexata]|uniref:Uncharacterized protein n=1 Tax=Pseudomassariella vexata TaxID=1141098 RepID=A0A1Y2DUL4_9PEZI|nr:uncharacterized protein BCR38DRAFT_409945 [Pseudomassariella vexata]ORY62960.1 hypothetical protein BCR38DRAFT_409945 [Pseudomassariella vexata]